MKKTLGWGLVAWTVATAAAVAQPLLVCGAQTHLDRKGDYLNGTTAQIDSGVWEWIIGSGDTYSNIQGITADGLFPATVSTTDPDFAAGAFETVNLLVGRYNADPALRPYAQDVDLLLDACAFDPGDYGLDPGLGGSQAYCDLAVSYYSRVVGQFPDPHANVDRHITPRKSLSGWDLAAHIRAAWRGGFLVYATGMIDRILERRPDWEHIPLGTFDYTEVSHGALVRVMLEMHAAGDLSAAHHTTAIELADGLIASQLPDGSWGEGDIQTTAYVVLGLRADPWNFTLPWQQAIIEGHDYFEALATPEPICGWPHPSDSEEYGEMNSEILMAMAAVNSLPFVDGFETSDTSAWTLSEGEAPPLGAYVPSIRSGLARIEPYR